MKRILIILMATVLLAGCIYATQNVEINGVDFEIPQEYQDGALDDGVYSLDNVFEIRCVDDNVASAIGLWAEEKDFSEDIEIGNHPVRHFSQHNGYVHGNQSHAYFISGKSVYQITWTGEEIDGDIEKLINDTPDSKISSKEFYNTLDKSFEIYKIQKIDELNKDAEYNDLEAKYRSQYSKEQTHDDTRFKEILYTYYL